MSCPDQQASLITAAGVGHHLVSPLIGRRAQLRAADDGFVNDLDSPQSSGRVFTQTLATFKTNSLSHIRENISIGLRMRLEHIYTAKRAAAHAPTPMLTLFQ